MEDLILDTATSKPMNAPDLEQHDWPTWFKYNIPETPGTYQLPLPDPIFQRDWKVPSTTKQLQHQISFFDLPVEIRLAIYTYAAILHDESSQFHPLDDCRILPPPRLYDRIYVPLIPRFEGHCHICRRAPAFLCETAPRPGGRHVHASTLQVLNNLSTVSKQFALEGRATWFGSLVHHITENYETKHFQNPRHFNTDFANLRKFLRAIGPSAKDIRNICIDAERGSWSARHTSPTVLPKCDDIERALECIEGLDHPGLKLTITFGATCKVMFLCEKEQGRLVVRDSWCHNCRCHGPSLICKTCGLRRFVQTRELR